ncbi:hypothetical protein QTP86_009175 [Hemibagrus guttatus]|nr:hypothetical protein QTP86_009175 [Hemibagrus guttatus]
MTSTAEPQTPNDVHSRAAGPSDVHRRAAASSDVHRRALAPSDVHRRTTAPGRRCLSRWKLELPEGREGGSRVLPDSPPLTTGFLVGKFETLHKKKVDTELLTSHLRRAQTPYTLQSLKLGRQKRRDHGKKKKNTISSATQSRSNYAFEFQGSIISRKGFANHPVLQSYHPPAHWIQSLTSGHVPTAFKKARVIPILKKPALDPSDISNYRPGVLEFVEQHWNGLLPTWMIAHIGCHSKYLMNTQKRNYSIKTIQNKKPRMNSEVRLLLKARDSAFKSGDAEGYSRNRANLKRGISKAKHAHKLRIEEHFHSNSDPRLMWKDIQTITDHKPSIQSLPTSNAFLPDELSHFFACFNKGVIHHTRNADSTVVHPISQSTTECQSVGHWYYREETVLPSQTLQD